MTPQEHLNRAIAMQGFGSSGVGLDEFLAKIREDYAHGRKSFAEFERYVGWALREADKADRQGRVIVFV